jgi:hypothetical protein
MIGVTLFGIFLTPVFYYVLTAFEGDKKLVGRPTSGPLPNGERKATAAPEAAALRKPDVAMP